MRWLMDKYGASNVMWHKQDITLNMTVVIWLTDPFVATIGYLTGGFGDGDVQCLCYQSYFGGYSIDRSSITITWRIV